MNNVPRFILTTVCLLTTSLAAWAQEVDLRGWEDTPGLYGYLFQPEAAWQAGLLNVEHRPVRDRVSGAGALSLTFRGDGAPATFVYRPPGPAFAGRKDWAGLSLWVKGDGSEGVGVLGIGDGGPNDPRVTFNLTQKTWQPMRVRWEDFRPPVASASVSAIFFSLTPDTKRPAAFLVDKLELVRGIGPSRDDDAVRAAGAKAAKEADVPRPADLAKFAKGRERFAALRAKLVEKQPVRVLVVGDAVASGSALWNVPPGARPRVLFWGRLADALKAKSPGSAVATVFVDGPESAVTQTPGAIRALKADAVIIELSASPPGVPVGAVSRARESVKALLDICRNARAEALVLPVPPLADPLRRVDYAAILAEEAGRSGVPCVDFAAFAAARGKGFEGEYYLAPDALNVQGHEAAAKLIESALVGP